MAKHYIPIDLAIGMTSYNIYEFNAMTEEELDEMLVYSKKLNSKMMDDLVAAMFEFCSINKLPAPRGWSINKGKFTLESFKRVEKRLFRKDIVYPEVKTYEPKFVLLFGDNVLIDENETKLVIAYLQGIRKGIELV